MSATQQVRPYETFTWIDLTSPARSDLDEVAQQYGLDPMLLIDSLQHGHLPKIELHEEYVFLILRAYSAEPRAPVTTVGELSNKIAFFMHKDRLITVHRAQFEFLKRLKPSYATPRHLVLDIVQHMVRSYREPVREQSAYMDTLERTLFLEKEHNLSVEDLYYQRSKARISRKLLTLSQGVITQLEAPKGMKSTRQDILDTLTSLLLLYDEVLEDAHNLTHVLMSLNAQKNNDVMKLLTIFSAFFLPLTFIAGIYGMNFDHMPELHWRWSYFLTLGVMALISLVIYGWFRRKRIL